MSESKSTLDSLVSTLKQQRDELKLQMHLASMDAKDEYDRLSSKVDDVSDQLAPLSDAVGETSENVFAALGLVADELKIGFDRVRKAVTDSGDE